MAKFKVTVRTDKVGSKVEDIIDLDDEDVQEMTEREIDEVLFDTICETGMIEWDREKIE